MHIRALVLLLAATPASGACERHQGGAPALSSSASASANANATNGYRDCSLRALAACENSNQLFWGESDRFGNSPPKQEIRDALDGFLKGAPALYGGMVAFAPASSAREALLGPGLRERLAGGEWFFSGFTPHAAPYQAAVLFDAHGNILVVALLDASTDAPQADVMSGEKFLLRVYSHGALRADRLARFETWARNAFAPAPEGLPPRRFDGTIAIEFDSKDWITRPLS